MTRWNQILIGLLAIQIAIAAAIRLRPEEPGVGPQRPLISGFQAASVERIAIFDAPGDGALPEAPAIEVERHGSGWLLKSHHGYPADGAKVRDLSSKLAALQSRGPMATSAARHAQLFVSEDQFERRIDYVVAGQAGSLFVGGPVGARKVAVRVAGSDEIHAVTGFSAAAVEATAGGWIVPEYFSIPAASVASLTLVRPAGEVVLERDAEAEGGWRISAGAPLGSDERPIDGAKIDRLLLAAARIQASEPADPAADLSQPLATIRLQMTEEEMPEEGISTAPEEHVITVAAGGGGGRYLVRAGDEGRPVFVRDWGLSPLVGLDAAELFAE